MRQPATFLLLACVALSVGATEVWRWKDADGVTHISDRPVPGAERVIVNAPRSGTPAEPVAAPSYPEGARPRAEYSSQSYARCVVSAPEQDAVFQAADSVVASVQVEPALQGGHRVQVFMNGALVTDWPGGAQNHALSNLYRGSHTLSARVVDENGRVLCVGPSITFHVRQPTLLSPARRPAG